MAKFEINNWKSYEIDFYNHGTEEEKRFLSSLSNHDHCVTCYNKSGTDWVKRLSGMTFRLNGMSYYPKLKEYLDYRLNLHLRKEKLKKINEFYEANQ
jgi:hypothetical protein